MSYFDERLKIGKYAEAILDDYLHRNGLVPYPVSRDLEDRGIDRIVADQNTSINVEYKADFRAASTGNIFLEHTKNNNGEGKPGWARTSEADLLLYYIPPTGVCYAFDMKLIQMHYAHITSTLRQGKVLSNPGYTATGYLLPIDKAIEIVAFRAMFTVGVYTEEDLLRKFEQEMLH